MLCSKYVFIAIKYLKIVTFGSCKLKQVLKIAFKSQIKDFKRLYCENKGFI